LNLDHKPTLTELDFEETAASGASVLSDVLDGRSIGFVIRGFLLPSHVDSIKSLIAAFPHPLFEPFAGYQALPRPFDQLEQNNIEGYRDEVNYLNSSEFVQLKASFMDRLHRVVGTTRVTASQPGHDHSVSEAWASARVLQPDLGSFELHCGNLFRNWNQKFFAKQEQAFDISQHLAFFTMIQKPTATCDIEIYRAHWGDFPQKSSTNALITASGQEVGLDYIPCHRVELNPGDLLIFDESNYWHRVTRFTGAERITFGGFVSRFKDSDAVLLWA